MMHVALAIALEATYQTWSRHTGKIITRRAFAEACRRRIIPALIAERTSQ